MTVDNRSVGPGSLAANAAQQTPEYFVGACVVKVCCIHAKIAQAKGPSPNKVLQGFFYLCSDRTGRVSSGVAWPATKKAPAGDTPPLHADGTVREVSIKTLVSWQRDKASIEANRGLRAT